MFTRGRLSGYNECVSSVDDQGMYGHRAKYYDAIYHWKKYDQESLRLRELLAAEGVRDGERIIEAACGTGSHLVHLKQWFEVSGFDISEDMLRIARAKLPGVKLFRADMADFAIEEPCDALVCLFSSIGYVFPEERLRAAARHFARAVRRGGVLIIEPWLNPETFVPGRQSMQTFSNDDLCLCRMAVGQREGERSIFDFNWLAVERDRKAVEHFIDRHELWLYSTDQLLNAVGDAGFECRFEVDGLMKERGLIVGRRR
jgi:SAM-dependent methyltransferase